MKVTHELTLIAKCPVNSGNDEYQCIVETECLIKVEDILEKAKALTKQKVFQEDLCAQLAGSIGGDAAVTLIGTHSGVKTTVRCESYEG